MTKKKKKEEEPQYTLRATRLEFPKFPDWKSLTDEEKLVVKRVAEILHEVDKVFICNDDKDSL